MIPKKQAQLLYEIDKNSRKSLSKIAKDLRLSQQALSYMLRKLLHDKIIKSYTLILDPSKFGLINYLVLIRISNHKKSVFNKILSYLSSSSSNLTQLYTTIGKWDVVALFSVPNPSYFNKAFKTILADIGNYVLSYEILNVVVMHKYGLNAINRTVKEESDIIIGGDREIIELDKDEKRILEHLSKNPNISFVKLSTLVNKNIKTVIRKVKLLMKNKVIKGFTVNLDLNKLNFQHHLLLLRLRGMDKSVERTFTELCKKIKNINILIKCFGYWDVVMSLIAYDNKDFKKCIDEIKESFGDYIVDIEIMQVESVEKFTFVPETIFKCID